MSGTQLLVGVVLVSIGLLGYLGLPSDQVTAAGQAFLILVVAAFRLSHRWAPLITSVLFPLAFWALIVHGSGERPITPAVAALLPAMLVLAVGIGHVLSLGERRLLFEQATAAQLLERLRLQLARELHDTAAQEISQAAMRAHAAALEPEIPAAMSSELSAIAGHCNRAVHDLRLLMANLREVPPGVDETPCLTTSADLKRVLDDQLAKLCDQGFIVDTTIRLDELNGLQVATIAKVVIEAVTNIRNHGTPGSQCHVLLVQDVDGVLGEFSNLHAHKSGGRGSGLGLVGIRERIEAAGGHVKILDDQGRWCLRFTVPNR